MVEGESRVAKRGTLKREANSLNHKLTHRYKNPYCDSCIRAEMKHFKTRWGAYQRELKKFGDLITFGAVDTSKVHDDVLILEKEVLVVRDCYAGLISAYPSSRMAKDDVVRAVRQFIGSKKVRQAYSDQAPQFIEAMNKMKIPIDHSLPGRPQTNSIAEGTNQFILTATATCLLEAGLPFVPVFSPCLVAACNLVLASVRVLPIFALAVLISNCVQFPVGYSLHRSFIFWFLGNAEQSSRWIESVATVCKSSVLFGSGCPELPHQVILVRLVDLGVVPKIPLRMSSTQRRAQ